MRRPNALWTTLTTLGLVAMASVAVAVPYAAAADATCYRPDDERPLVFDVRVRPNPYPADLDHTPSSEVGTFVSAEIWDMPNTDDASEHNAIVGATLEIDGRTVTAMQARDGSFDRIRETAWTVLPPSTMRPGVHDLRIVGTDACGNRGSTHARVYHLTFLLTGTCDDASPGVCAALD